YHLAFLDELTFEHRHLTPFRDEHFVVRAAINRVDAVSRRNDETTLAFGFLAEADGARDLGKNCRLFRTTRFEQVCNSRQTTGDVTGFRSFLRNTRDYVTYCYVLAVFNANDGFGWQEVVSRSVRTRQRYWLAFGVEQSHGR